MLLTSIVQHFLSQLRRRIRLPMLLTLFAAVSVMVVASRPPLLSQGGMQWYMVDPHVHSSLSSEAYSDLGIHSQAAKSLGYNAIFVSDHNGGSSFHINNLTANYMIFEDSYTRWEAGTFGDLDSTLNELAVSPAPVNTGAASLHLESSSTDLDYGETHIWTKRGPNSRSGDIIIDVAVYPVQIDANSGAYISVSIGGDPSVVTSPAGYTTQAGVISPGKTTVLVWQLGNPRLDQTDPNDRVITYPLAYTLNSWNVYQINVSDALNDIPAADRPLDYNGLTYVKMAVGAVDGGAEAYFDTFVIQAANPENPADEYVYRTSVSNLYDTSDFKIFPAFEAGQQTHTQRFNFAITNPNDYTHYDYGHLSIADTHASGYMAQMNHPGSTISVQEVIDNRAYGADAVETNKDDQVDAWEGILLQGTPIIAGWSSDTHYGVSNGKRATFIYAPSLTLDDLLKSYFEGRIYDARNYFQGRVIFNRDPASADPYPARFPVYISDAESTVDVSLDIDQGLSSSWTIRWYANDQEIAIENPVGGAYQETKAIPLSGAHTYARAEVRGSSGSDRALTQAILFKDVADLPQGRSFHVEEVITPSGINYNVSNIKGVTNASWSAVSELLHLDLENPINALTRLSMVTTTGPQNYKVDGQVITPSVSLAAFRNASGDAWYYDSGASILHMKALHVSTVAAIDVEFGSGGDTTPPTTPTNVSAVALHLGRIDLSWDPSTDDVAVDGYTIRRNGAVLTTVGAGATTFADLTVAPATAYAYTVDAFDTSNNFSAESAPPASATTPSSSTFTFDVTADAYVKSDSPTNNYGSNTNLRLDGSPLLNSYLLFDVQELVGFVQSAKLRVYAETSSSIGYQVHGMTDTSWIESSINYNNAPAIGATIDGSGAYSANAWTETDVLSQVSGNGLLSFALTTSSNTALRYTSREGGGGNHPQLIVEVSDTAPPTPTPTPTPQPGSYTFAPEADAYVYANVPGSNYGTSSTLRTDASPVRKSYLRFDVQGIAGTVITATLRIYAETTNNTGYDLYDVSDDSWVETGVTFTTAPPTGALLGASGGFSAGTWTEVDVTNVVSGAGLASFAMISTDNRNTRYASRETSSGNVPELIVETEGEQGMAAASLAALPTPTPRRDSSVAAEEIIVVGPELYLPFVRR